MFDEKILIIDGHPVYIEKVEGFLRGLTFQNIALARTGQEATEQIEREQPKMIILSSTLPDMDSKDLCQFIRQKSSPTTRIIVQVGLFTDPNEIEWFKKNGANIVLDRKEKDMDPLQSAIISLL